MSISSSTRFSALPSLASNGRRFVSYSPVLRRPPHHLPPIIPSVVARIDSEHFVKTEFSGLKFQTVEDLHKSIIPLLVEARLVATSVYNEEMGSKISQDSTQAPLFIWLYSQGLLDTLTTASEAEMRIAINSLFYILSLCGALKETVWKDCVFYELNFNHLDFSGAEFTGCEFVSMNMVASNFSQARVSNSIFQDSNVLALFHLSELDSVVFKNNVWELIEVIPATRSTGDRTSRIAVSFSHAQFLNVQFLDQDGLPLEPSHLIPQAKGRPAFYQSPQSHLSCQSLLRHRQLRRV